MNIDIELLDEMIENSTIVDEIDNKIASCIIGGSSKIIVQNQSN